LEKSGDGSDAHHHRDGTRIRGTEAAFCKRACPAYLGSQVSGVRCGLARDVDRFEPRAAPVDSTSHGGLDRIDEWSERIKHRLVAAARTAEVNKGVVSC